jgi:F-type H+-transporting ATPase subunit c
LSRPASPPDSARSGRRWGKEGRFVGLAMIESTAIYAFVVSMILIFANPFWNHVLAQATGK